MDKTQIRKKVFIRHNRIKDIILIQRWCGLSLLFSLFIFRDKRENLIWLAPCLVSCFSICTQNMEILVLVSFLQPLVFLIFGGERIWLILRLKNEERDLIRRPYLREEECASSLTMWIEENAVLDWSVVTMPAMWDSCAMKVLTLLYDSWNTLHSLN